MDYIMKVAILISGRLKCYEKCLIPVLESRNYDVDLFLSINSEKDDYHKRAFEDLSKWLKNEYTSPYIPPQSYKNIFINMNSGTNEPFPYNILSMFFNDRKAFELATEYADNNNFEYDAYMKYRADIITDHLPDVSKTNERKIFSVIPACNHSVPLIDRSKPTIYNGPGDWHLQNTEVVNWVSDAIVYGNRMSMDVYTQTYNYCLEMNELWKGLYPIAFEPSVTHNVYDKNLSVEYFSLSYSHDPSRHH
jgi:hypothetical protein